MSFNQRGVISTLTGGPLKLMDKLTFLGSSVSTSENYNNTRLAKAWVAINRLSVIWRSDLTYKIKRRSFQVAVLQYGCTTWTLSKRIEKKLDGNYTRMLQGVLNMTGRQHPTKQQLYGHLLAIMKSTSVRPTRDAGHCWRSKDELISDIYSSGPLSHGRAKVGPPAISYIQQLRADTGYKLKDLPGAMDDRDG